MQERIEEVEKIRVKYFNGVAPGIVIMAMLLNKWGILFLLIINLGILFLLKKSLKQLFLTTLPFKVARQYGTEWARLGWLLVPPRQRVGMNSTSVYGRR